MPFSSLRKGKSWWAKKTACDLYISAFLRPKRFRKSDMATSKALDLVPTTLDVRNALAGSQGNPQLTALAIDLAGMAYAFHWPLEFADVMAAGGFDIVIGNPPWEVMQLSEEEYFSTRDAEIAALAGATRKKAIAELVHTNPTLFAEYEVTKRIFEASNEFARESGVLIELRVQGQYLLVVRRAFSKFVGRDRKCRYHCPYRHRYRF